MYLYFCFKSFRFKSNFFVTSNTTQAMFKQKQNNFCRTFVYTLIKKFSCLTNDFDLKIDFKEKKWISF